MFFVGTFELSIDTKNRLSVPYLIRSKLDPSRDGRAFYVLPGRFPQTLAIFPDEYFERLRMSAPLADDLSDGTYAWKQFEYSQAALLEPDNQGRILVPERLLRRCGIEREATLIGVQDHLELWNRKAYADFQERMWPDYPARRTDAWAELKALQASEKASESTD